MKLLKICSNPQLLADDEYVPNEFRLLFKDECNKIDEACKIARKNYMNNEKTLIWSVFRKNIDLITLKLKDIGAEFIYGGVKTGDVTDPETREYKINRFNNHKFKTLFRKNLTRNFFLIPILNVFPKH